MNNKKSQGELITTVLMILIILAAIAGIAYFVNNMIQSKINSAQQHSECLEALIEIEPVGVGSNSLVLRNIGTRVINSISIFKSGNLVSAFPVSSGLVSYWPLDSNTEDYFGQNDGVNSGAIQTSGKIGGAYSFDGMDDYINLGNKNNLDSITGFTISVWINERNSAEAFRYIVKKQQTGSGGYLSMTYLNYPYFYVFNSSGSSCVAVKYTSLGTNVWKHYIGMWNRSDVFVYIDAVLQDSSSCGSNFLNPSSTNLIFGSYLNGSLDEVMIFNRSLSAEEINQLYTSRIKLNFSAGASLPVSISPLVSGDRIEVSASIISSKGNEVNCGLRASTVVA